MFFYVVLLCLFVCFSISPQMLASLLSAISPSTDKSNPRSCLLCQQIVSELLPCEREYAEKLRPRDASHVNQDHLPFYLSQVSTIQITGECANGKEDNHFYERNLSIVTSQFNTQNVVDNWFSSLPS